MAAQRRTGRVTLHDVAREAGVSIATVSYCLSGKPYVKDVTRARVQAAIDKLGYVANSTARTLKTGRTGMITLTVQSLEQPYYAELAEHVIDVAYRRGYRVMVESAGFRRGRVAGIETVRCGMSDGLIMTPTAMKAGEEGQLDGDYPLVLVGHHPFDPICPEFAVNDVRAAFDATMHLVHSGCRRIAFIGAQSGLTGYGRPVGVRRLEGYRRALEAAGIAFDDRLVRNAFMWDEDEGANAVSGLLGMHADPDGIVVGNDAMAFGVIRRLANYGLRVPDDVRVIGFDNVRQCRCTIPSLATVDVGRREVAERAVDSLIVQIEEGRRATPVQVTVGHRIVCRESAPAVAEGRRAV
ncbi:LacI family DNA-binding transcriptional regulator [Bifidobacterium avesanii]|uniref:LacI family DNA-binding transcriptional regulator n=1 Tax=Bifidobacterium avesanii TaxID=1798157 RepID=UPI0013842C7D|nr:LacI family DNA-binding transcriptional regulator [Bifidobacterium avesanii]KAB8290125.1 LacI family transcriptional regulator [Bifidobacterium avesanii]